MTACCGTAYVFACGSSCLLLFLKLYRYLRATKWISADVAIERLEGTLKWRREFGIYDLTAEHIEPEVRFSQTL